MSLKDRLRKEIKKKELRAYVPENNAAEFIGLGVLEPLIAEPLINSVYVNGAKNVYIQRKGVVMQSTVTFRDNVQLENLVKKVTANIGVQLDDKNPYVEFNHRLGVNVAMTLPPLSNNAMIFIKNYSDNFANFKTLTDERSVSKEIAMFLEATTYIEGSIIIAGKKDTLKTTLLSALAKKVTPKDRYFLFDYKQELKFEESYYTTFDFSSFKDSAQKQALISSLFTSNPSRVFVNSAKDDLVYFVSEALSGYNNLIVTLEASNKQEALDRIIDSILENKPYLHYQDAKKLACSIFKLIIFVDTNEIGQRKVSSVSEIDNDCEINDIFYLGDVKEHVSSGFVPDFYEQIKESSLLIGSNIFDSSYIHTYTQVFEEEISENKKNIDILKKFKKKSAVEELKEDEITEQDYLEFLGDDTEQIDIEDL